MYKSIVFDLGGVMIDFDPRGYLVDRLCNAETEEEAENAQLVILSVGEDDEGEYLDVVDDDLWQRGMEAAGCRAHLPL